MDAYAPALIAKGLTGMIGKENAAGSYRCNERAYRRIFRCDRRGRCAISKCIKSCEVIAYEDLGTEAIRKLTVENFPAVVLIDSYGNKI